MKKIPTLFKRNFIGKREFVITDEITNGCEEAFLHGVAKIKVDGACCAIINGELYKRYDAKKGKTPPMGAIPCQTAPDPITSHWPHWVKCDINNPNDKWFMQAYHNTHGFPLDGTYEAVGKHFNGNPYRYGYDFLVRHADIADVDVERTFDGVKRWLEGHQSEGLVFWLNGEPVCKIKRSDFGLAWPE